MKHLDLYLLRKAIDGQVDYSSTRFALGRLIQKNLGCYPDLPEAPRPGAIELGTCDATNVYGMVDFIGAVKECRAPYNRAALLRRAIDMYAGDLTLTPEQTSDPAVQARFDAREIPRNKLRRGDDKLTFEIAVCMVRMQPEASVQLTTADDKSDQYNLEDKIIAGANECIGGAQQMTVDPNVFRDYVSDAVYRWVVAARNVDSLLPPAHKG